ncbi:hypothetical protein [Klebsiella oxytoca]|uniref:hypothetical protein n=1 Tax=Klebsiella oxytoca TaxID=571 RepID=UPI0039C96159
MSRIWGVITVLIAGLTVTSVPAATFTYNYTWRNGRDQTGQPAEGQPAGTCSFVVPDTRPLQVPRTLVVDSAAPVGTVLYAWDFANFLPGFRIQCTGSGISTSEGSHYLIVNGAVLNGLMTGQIIFNNLTRGEGFSSSNPVYATTLSGIGLRMFVKADTDSLLKSVTDSVPYRQQVILQNAGGQMSIPATPRDIVYPWGTNSGNPSARLQLYVDKLSNNPAQFILADGAAGFSVKAELVKIANTVQYGNLGLAGNPMATWSLVTAALNLVPPTDFLTGNAITVVSPSCRLRTTDYTVSMGTWASDTVNHTGAPATGAAVPVGLDLECSGKVADVQFRFEDTGSSPSSLAEKNITLYDGGGNKVNGLEIQMKYNGERINVDGVTQTSTGSHGQVRTEAESVPLYTSTSQAMFTANYIQNGPIAVDGNNYTGPASGKVNIWVTYN